MMSRAEEEQAMQEDQDMMDGLGASPSMSADDPTTYDPTQGRGTDAWQETLRRQAALNARLRRN